MIGDILIRRRSGSKGLYDEMAKSSEEGSVFLLHPWRIGQNKYIKVLIDIMEKYENRLCALSALAQRRKGIALRRDIGEFSTKELIMRIFSR